MTKIVMGVDALGAYLPTVAFVERLRFPEPTAALVHVANERLPYVPAFGDLPKLEAEYAEVSHRLGQAALQEAKEQLCAKGIATDCRLVHGNAAERLIEAAEEANADLIAVNTKRGGVARSSYIGSVGRALAIGSPASVLLVKGTQGKRYYFRAVYATDHSPFADRCLERFLQLAPQGIEEVHVVSAWEIDDRAAEILGRDPATLGGDADRWIEESIQERNLEVCRKMEQAGYAARSIVKRGPPNEVIHRAMADVRADLLVVGSQGAGAMQKTLVGSVSLHQATAEFYPVLIVRPREA